MSREHLLKALGKGIRYDGRKLTEYRKITVEYGASESAEGSAKVSFGDTELIAGVKLGVETPYSDTPDQGNLMVNVELLPLSSPMYEPGPPGEEAIELARVVDRGIRESKSIDTKNLCITPGEKAWGVIIDICSLNAAGGMFDAAGLAAIAAVKDAKFPAIDEHGAADYNTKTDKGLPLTRLPIAITVYMIGEHLLVDPLTEEEANTDGRLTLALVDDGAICALQKGGEAPLTIATIGEMVKIAQEKSKELRKHL